MDKIYRFRAHAFVEVRADSLHRAKELLKTIHGHDRVFTTFEEKKESNETVFSFAVPTSFESLELPK